MGKSTSVLTRAVRHTEFMEPYPTGCWVFTGSNHNGYGMINVDRRPQGVHRAVWEYLNGPIPKPLEIDHLCRNRACWNPSHLEVVTRTVNVQRGLGPEVAKRTIRIAMVASVAKKRAQTHCLRGHLLTPDNVYVCKRGHRNCRQCGRQRQLEYKARKQTMPATAITL